MKLKKWAKATFLIIAEIATIIGVMNLENNTTYAMKLSLIAIMIIAENLIMFIEGE